MSLRDLDLKQKLKLKFYHNKTSTFGVEVGGVYVCVYVRVGISFHTAILNHSTIKRVFLLL